MVSWQPSCPVVMRRDSRPRRRRGEVKNHWRRLHWNDHDDFLKSSTTTSTAVAFGGHSSRYQLALGLPCPSGRGLVGGPAAAPVSAAALRWIWKPARKVHLLKGTEADVMDAMIRGGVSNTSAAWPTSSSLMMGAVEGGGGAPAGEFPGNTLLERRMDMADARLSELPAYIGSCTTRFIPTRPSWWSHITEIRTGLTLNVNRGGRGRPF